MRIFLSISALLIFVFGYQICSLVYDPCINIIGWYDLRFNLYAVVLLLCFIVATPKDGNKFLRFVLCIGVGMSSSDVLDRIFFDTTKFTNDDIVMTGLTLLISYLEIYTTHLSKIKRLCLLTKSKL